MRCQFNLARRLNAEPVNAERARLQGAANAAVAAGGRALPAPGFSMYYFFFATDGSAPKRPLRY